jgi:2-C-methyl-D-erythritol 4-phosphate cytidylyltransferase
VDTIKIADARKRVVSTPDRALLWHAQTPQGIRRSVFLNAYKVNGAADATDDVQLVERAGGTVGIVWGPATNFKITTPEDLARAEKLLDRS